MGNEGQIGAVGGGTTRRDFRVNEWGSYHDFWLLAFFLRYGRS